MAKQRIFIGLQEIAGSAADMCRGLRELGYKCDFVTPFQNRFQYPDATNNWFIRLVRKSYEKWSQAYADRKDMARIGWKFFTKTLMLALFISALVKYDVFIFYFNRTFSKKWWDLPILKFFRKTIVFIYVGSDSRPMYINGKSLPYLEQDDLSAWLEMIAQQKYKIKRAGLYADHIIDLPPQAYFHERKYIHFNIIGIPREVPASKFEEPEDQSPNRALKILHAPSHPETKGTPLIRQVIERLKAKGHALEYIEIINQPNEAVMKSLAECDFVIDQVYADTPLAGFATEAAFFGKPSISGSYYIDGINNDFPLELMPPSLFVHPDDIEAAIEKMIVDHEFRRKMGLEARQYAESYLKPAMVASRLMKLIDEGPPESWLRDPYELKYLHGYGVSEENVKRMVAAVIKAGGIKALQLSDKPALEKAFMEFAGCKTSGSED
ncbi:hypothetical protein LJB99_00480 [Deltaproteobacteria bacterium OttesenSCG-928-K17]|nr:hypothetical protein [Deltaproteobacteria bacterium OttesenSCG-928-K17]